MKTWIQSLKSIFNGCSEISTQGGNIHPHGNLTLKGQEAHFGLFENLGNFY